ncbi:MAG: lysostaphin resistance A-like protein [Cryomorphaceae bacterium]|nr:CPBP family intramembrane metalloprotease [Flavobacteriales bacterium]
MSKVRRDVGLIAISTAFVLTGFLALTLDEAAADALSETYILSITDFGLWPFLVFVLVLAPVLEEVCFRLWIRERYFGGVFLMVAVLFISIDGIILRVLVTLLVIPTIVYYKRLKRAVSLYPTAAILTAALFFSFAHAFNFSEIHFAHFWLFMIFLGLGSIFGLIRLRFGLWAAVLLHLFYNLLVTIPILPPWSGSAQQIENAVLIEHGIFNSKNESADYENVVCKNCPSETLLQKVAREAYPEALIVLDSSEEPTFAKFTLKSEFPVDFQSILGVLESRFELKIKITRKDRDEILIQFIEHPDFGFSTENLVKHRPKTIDGRSFSHARSFAAHLENEYAVKLTCIENCDAALVLPFRSGLSLDENLNNLADLGLIEYTSGKRKMQVVTISSRK